MNLKEHFIDARLLLQKKKKKKFYCKNEQYSRITGWNEY